MSKKEEDNARDQARVQFKSIKEMVEALEAPEGTSDYAEALEAIQGSPLSIEVRSGWTSLGNEFEAEEFMILLCTGGPAVRIIGDLNQFREPEKARLEYQGWFRPWECFIRVEWNC